MRSDGSSSSVRSSTSSFDDPDGVLFNDVFGGPPKYTNTSYADFNCYSIFKSGKTNNNNDDNIKTSSLPVYDKPVYGEDMFDELPGVKSKSVSSSDDVFPTITSPNHNKSHFDDLLGNMGINEPKTSASSEFDDLLAGFASASPGTSSSLKKVLYLMSFNALLFWGYGEGLRVEVRILYSYKRVKIWVLLKMANMISSSAFSESTYPSKPAGDSNKSSSVQDDPFVVLESTSAPANSTPGEFSDPLEEIAKLGKSGTAKTGASSVGGEVFDDLDPLSGFNKPVRPLFPEKKTGGKDRSPSKVGPGRRDAHNSTSRETIGTQSFRYSGSHSQKKAPGDSFQESPHFDMPSEDPLRSFGEAAPPPYADNDLHETTSNAPPPSRPPPPIPRHSSKLEASFFASNARKGEGYSSPYHNQYSESPKPVCPAVKSPPVSQLDELEDFARGWSQSNIDENADVLSEEVMNANSVAAASAAAIKEAMDRAEAKVRHAKEVREREYAKSGKIKEAVHLERVEQAINEVQEREFRENQERLENERRQRGKEEKERAQRKVERERERVREIEKERARQAAAVQRAQAEARERAAAEAKERDEKAAAEAREKGHEKASDAKAVVEARRASSAPKTRTSTPANVFDSQFLNKAGSEGPKSTAGVASSNMRKASSTTSFVDDLSSIFGASASSGEFQDVEGETEERRRARIECHQRTQERAAKALAEKK
ncbi:putative ubiquitin carboxyl-terminal hydrolase 5-like [Capsicum annuum]|nr:putative ubiquitin carboxyl-terminal hydrolase 5-like [Capsicum annuum]